MFSDYFQEHLGSFSPIFAGLEDMNSAVHNILLETSKVLDKKVLGIQGYNQCQCHREISQFHGKRIRNDRFFHFQPRVILLQAFLQSLRQGF